MEFSNESLIKMHDRRALYNSKFGQWYLDYFVENGGTFEFNEELKMNVATSLPASLFNKSERICRCMDLWIWDAYHQNKILDLQKVNRCKNTRFCPNCKMLDVAKFIHKFRSIFEEYESNGYRFYMLTLTVPSCPVSGRELRRMIKRLNKAFAKLFTKFGYDDEKALKDRLISIFGGIRVLEVTCNEETGFHPHFHCVVLLKDEPAEELLEKTIEGKWSYKRESFNLHSLIDMQLTKIWGMIWYGHRLTKRKIESYVVEPKEAFVQVNGEYLEDKVLQVDFRPLDEAGIFEVFKYTFKSSEVANYEVFKGLVDGLENVRIRQGFGILYNVKVNDDELEEGELQGLELEVPEEPTQLITREILSLVNEYGNYRKISRFDAKTSLAELIED